MRISFFTGYLRFHNRARPAKRNGVETLVIMQTADFNFELPPELVAQVPAPARDQSRLLVLDRRSDALQHRVFPDLLSFLQGGDLLVLNNSRVIPARLRGLNARTGGRFELLLLRENALNDWWAMVRPGKRAQSGTRIVLTDPQGCPTPASALVTGTNLEGHRRLRFEGSENIAGLLESIGEMPLPPYITRQAPSRLDMDRERYQTVYAASPGSVAAPTAGLHFTDGLLERIGALGVRTCFVTLHVGPGTFAPVKADSLAGHTMHEEIFDVSPETARLINDTRQKGHRVFAVGTTSVRVLESVAAQHSGQIVPGSGSTRIFIYPPFEFRVVDALLTNFHLPRSTLLMLVSAFAAPGQTAGRAKVLHAYSQAIEQKYRFFSYGDAMLLL